MSAAGIKKKKKGVYWSKVNVQPLSNVPLLCQFHIFATNIITKVNIFTEDIKREDDVKV